MDKYRSELAFEDELIEYLQHVGDTKQWKYEESIKTTNDLWNNFRNILEKHNNDKLNGNPLTENEFSLIRKEIECIDNPYQAGMFLYGLNGVSQINLNRDDGTSVYLTVFDQDQIGGGNTEYQIVNQIERNPVVAGKRSRRFDVTLLINGLPIIQIEEKGAAISTDAAFNQMQQYLDERQYTGIYATLQIIVGMTRNEIRYMALPNDADHFNTDFAFEWQDEKDNRPIHDWKLFASKVLSIPMAHQLATNYMILDGTPHHQMIKVMRSYQVYATRRVLDKIRKHDFEVDDQRLGYVWHTTGSGKTISSFKAAWLASRLPNVDKVIFLVDRVALTNQTIAEYQAYDPEYDPETSFNGVVSDTDNTYQLRKKVKNRKGGIIVTSTQKMATLVRSGFKSDQHIVFIVDEAHRSTGGDMLNDIKQAFPHSGWVGYTGTPVFREDLKNGKPSHRQQPTTHDIFGDVLHIYTIREAIADHNVLGFKVDFQTTLGEEQLDNEYLPQYFRKRHPSWSDQDIKNKIASLDQKYMDDLVEPSVYDNNPDHVKLVVQDIYDHWLNRSNSGKYSAILTTHVGGGKDSKSMAMMYFQEFQRQNELRPTEQRLKVAITFSQDTTNGDHQLENNRSLSSAIEAYNNEFGTSFNDTTVKEYTENVVNRLARTLGDDDEQQHLDIVIVVDQLLTGFNAPMLNTLYVDRTLKGANLIQAYSRTNRVQDMSAKPYGRIVNYRWPMNAEKLMNEAIQTYANRQSAAVQGKLDIQPTEIVEKPYSELVDDLAKVISQIKKLTDDFDDVPPSEAAQKDLYYKLCQYNNLMVKIKQDDNYDREHPEKLRDQVNITEEKETALVGRIAGKLTYLLKEEDEDNFNITLKMEHIKDVKVNFDYINELLAQLANQLHDGDLDGANQTNDQLQSRINDLDNPKQIEQIIAFIQALFDHQIHNVIYPMQGEHADELIRQHTLSSKQAEILKFKQRWGLIDLPSENTIDKLIDHHTYEMDDLDSQGELSTLIKEAQVNYKVKAADHQIQQLSKIKYRKDVKQAFSEFADKMTQKY